MYQGIDRNKVGIKGGILMSFSIVLALVAISCLALTVVCLLTWGFLWPVFLPLAVTTTGFSIGYWVSRGRSQSRGRSS